MTFALLTFIPQSLYQDDKTVKWFWTKFEAISGSEWTARNALLSAKSPIVVLRMVDWSKVNILKSRGAHTDQLN